MPHKDPIERRKYLAAWRAANKAKIKEYLYKWYQANKPRMQIQSKNYRVLNRLKLSAINAVWRELNKPRLKDQQRAWRQRNKPKIRQRNKARRQRAGIILPIPQPLLDNKFRRQRGLCIYCGAILIKGTFQCHLDHKTPLSRGGTHTIDNVHWTCQPCNDSKGSKTHDEFIAKRKQA